MTVLIECFVYRDIVIVRNIWLDLDPWNQLAVTSEDDMGEQIPCWRSKTRLKEG